MKPIVFNGTVERSTGFNSYHIVRVPFSVEKTFSTKASVRVFVTVNDHRMDRALMPDGDGGHYIIFGGEMRKKAGMKNGGTYQLSIIENKKPLDLVLPVELSEALNADDDAMNQWNKLTPGMHRNIIYWVGSAKRAETRLQRAVEMIRRLTTPGTLFGNKPIQ